MPQSSQLKNQLFGLRTSSLLEQLKLEERSIQAQQAALNKAIVDFDVIIAKKNQDSLKAVAENEHTIATTQEIIERKRKDVELLDNQVKNNEDKLANLSLKHAEKVEAMAKEIVKYADELDLLKVLYADLQNLYAHDQERLDLLHQYIDIAQKQLEDKQASQEQVQKATDTLLKEQEASRKTAKQDLRTANDEVTAITNQHTTIQQEIVALNKTKTELTSEVNDLNNQIYDTQQKLDDLTANFTVMTEQTLTKTRELEEKEKNLAERELELNRMKRRIQSERSLL